MPYISGGSTSASAAASLLAFFVQTAGTSQTTTSATQADVDATNAAITFTAPANGIVLVRATCWCQMASAAQFAFLGLREGSTNVAGPNQAILGNATFGQQVLASPTWRLTGVSAGSHTYKLAFSVNGGISFTVQQIGSTATTFPVTMEVWAGV